MVHEVFCGRFVTRWIARGKFKLEIEIKFTHVKSRFFEFVNDRVDNRINDPGKCFLIVRNFIRQIIGGFISYVFSKVVGRLIGNDVSNFVFGCFVSRVFCDFEFFVDILADFVVDFVVGTFVGTFVDILGRVVDHRVSNRGRIIFDDAVDR